MGFPESYLWDIFSQAEDSGDPVKYDTASVSIYIEDVNDSAPKFLDSPYHVRVVEGGSGVDGGGGGSNGELPRWLFVLFVFILLIVL